MITDRAKLSVLRFHEVTSRKLPRMSFEMGGWGGTSTKGSVYYGTPTLNDTKSQKAAAFCLAVNESHALCVILPAKTYCSSE